MLRFQSILLFLFSCNVLLSQDTLRISALSANETGKTILRFGPSSAEGLNFFIRNGISINFINEESGARQLLSAEMKPKELSWWKENFTVKDSLVGLAATLLYLPPNSVQTGEAENSIQQKADLLNNRFGFLMLTADRDMQVADALGMRFVHNHGKKSGKGIYEFVWNNCAHEMHCDTTWLMVDFAEEKMQAIAPTPQLKSMEKCIELNWDLPELTEFSGFYVYKIDNSGKEIKINPGIVIPATASGRAYYSYRDSVANYVPCRYVIKAVNAFGELSRPSAEVTGMARDYTAPSAAQELKIEAIENRKLILNWKRNPDTEKVNQRVFLASRIDGNYEAVSELIAADIHEFKYELPGDFDAAFFKILSLDTAGNGAWSLPAYGFIPDSIPPAPPTGLKGFVDTSAVVTLTWNAGEERDIIGYRVFYANAGDHMFTNLSGKPLADTVFRDTIARLTLTRDIFYRVVAVDHNYNHSEPSAPIALKRPDHIPPVAAVIKDTRVSETGLELSWINSSSTDLAEIRILIRKQGEASWKETAKTKKPDIPQTFTFSALEKATWYEVTIESADSTGHLTLCEKPYAFRTFDRGIRQAPQNLKASRVSGKKMVELSWDGNFPSGSRALIYRKAPDSPGLSKYDLVACTGKYTDNKIRVAGNYEYSLKIIYPDGGESIPVEAVKLNLSEN
ncbi:MAG: fibronectin type III domain-containing protein [Bacteroidia bacterium]